MRLWALRVLLDDDAATAAGRLPARSTTRFLRVPAAPLSEPVRSARDGGTVTRRSTGVFWHPSLDTVIEPLEPFVGPEGSDFEPELLWDQAGGQVEEYLRVFGRPDQTAAWRERRPYVTELAEA
ncbi:hypothetical protein [Streptosporangium sp. G12]